MLPPQNIDCPLCKAHDRVEKVSSVYQQGISEGNYSGTSYQVGSAGGHLMVSKCVTRFSVTNQTQITQMLVPPLHPGQYYRSDNAGMGQIILGALLLFSVPLLLEVISNMPGVTNQAQLPITVGIIFMVILAVVFIPLGIIRNSRAHVAHTSRVQSAIPQWQQACANWDRLYYCLRHDIVFDPVDSARYVRPAQIHTLL